MMGGSPRKCSVRTEFCPEPGLDVQTGTIGQREIGFTGKASAAEKYADLRKRVSRPVKGDPRGVADDHEPTVPVPARAVRRQTACTMTPREKFTPKGAVLSQVLAGDSHPGALVLRVQQFGILKPPAYHTVPYRALLGARSRTFLSRQ